MMPVKLFAAAAAAFAVLAIVLKTMGASSGGTADLYLHFTYIVLSRWHVVLLGAAVSAIFAAVYYGCGHLLRFSMNGGVSLAHFILTAGSFGVLLFVLYAIRPDVRPDNPGSGNVMLFYIVLPVLFFLLGCLLFAFNFAGALVRSLRTQ